MYENVSIEMGKLPPSWQSGLAKNITFCVTEDCNLACKYCYMSGKNDTKKMSFDTAKKAVDYILSNREDFDEPSVIWEFIGGEPFLEIELIDKISDYIKTQMYLLNHRWFNSYRFSFSTNGLLYHKPKVQEYIKKNRHHLSIGISVDGNKIKHDLQRVKPDGSGSYDEVIKNVPLWQKQFPDSGTKATFAHDDLPYLKDSVISLWNIGIKNVAANVIFEDVWEDGDDKIIEQQLKELADYVLENELWKEHSVRFFDPNIGFPLDDEQLLKNHCGAGKMLAIDCEGNFVPCVRFYNFTLNNRDSLYIGNIYDGIDYNKTRPFLALTVKSQSKKECLDCDVATGCAWCQGNNYDTADSDTIYQRAISICDMHKATVRANIYFWDKFEKTTGLASERRKNEQKFNRFETNENTCLQFIMSDNMTPHCAYRNTKNTNDSMTKEIFGKGISFCKENDFTPFILGHNQDIQDTDSYMSIDNARNSYQNTIVVHDNEIISTTQSENCILLINKNNLNNLFDYISELFKYSYRINLILESIENWDKQDIEMYEQQLDKLIPYIANTYKNSIPVELSVLTDVWNFRTMRNCDAGTASFALAPNGKIYICPAFYFENPDNYVGTLENGIEVKNSELLELNNAPICSVCDVYSSRRCKYLSKKLTNEFNTPSKIQCEISHIEREKSRELQNLIMSQTQNRFLNPLEKISYSDPLEKLEILRTKGSVLNA